MVRRIRSTRRCLLGRSLVVCLLATLVLEACLHQVEGFAPLPTRTRSVTRSTFSSCIFTAYRSFDDDDDDDRDCTAADESGIPQLPAFGASSLGTSFASSLDSSSSSLNNSTTFFVGNRKFELLYTCKICETRNSHLVSRIAYRNGVVISRCNGCQTQHLIADNLGWTNIWQGHGEANIEEYFANRGQEEKVHRVTPQVFDLEKILVRDTKSGSIIGDDGNPALE
jgi:DNL zinc finger